VKPETPPPRGKRKWEEVNVAVKRRLKKNQEGNEPMGEGGGGVLRVLVGGRTWAGLRLGGIYDHCNRNKEETLAQRPRKSEPGIGQHASR